jgi:hypothetical protein
VQEHWLPVLKGKLPLRLPRTNREMHSWVVDGNTVHVIYDITPDPAGNGLHFEFSFPARITRDELRRFAEWLASSGYAGMTVH